MNETILVVDDEPIVLKLVAAALVDAGYTLLRAASPDEGLRICREQGEANRLIDLAIVDVVMPGMSGPELIECLSHCGIAPNRLLYISGYPREFIVGRRNVDPAANFLQKPFTVAKLLSAVKDMLAGTE